MIISSLSLVLTSMFAIAAGQTDLDIPLDFSVSFVDPPISPLILLDQPQTINYVVNRGDGPFRSSLILCQTSAGEDEEISSANTFKILDSDVCLSAAQIPNCELVSSGETNSLTFTLQLQNPASFSNDGWNNYFFCSTEGEGKNVCSSYSPLFDVAPNAQSAEPSPNLDQRPSLTAPITVVSTRTVLSLVKVPTLPSAALGGPLSSIIRSVSESQSVSTSFITASMSPSTTRTIISEAVLGTLAPAKPGSSSSKSKLPTGAIVGIALGALLFISVIALAVVFLCFRKRRHRKENLPPGGPEQVMLARSLHPNRYSQSRDAFAEKEGPNILIHPNSNDSNFTDHEPQQRHSALSPLENSSSALYNGPAASAPRRKPIASANAPTVSRNLSSSASSPNSPNSPNNASAFEQYHDHSPTTYSPADTQEVRYGDARHTPQAFQGTLQTPFLSEPGMSEEEVARLEEEERRIDAAIAAAEARWNRQHSRQKPLNPLP